MLKNYLKIAYRNLLRKKLFYLINIIGLAIGLSAAIVIFLVVKYEFSFEQFHPNKDRIFRVTTITRFAGKEFPNGGVPAPLGEAVKKEIPGLEEVAAFHTWHPNVSIPAQKEEAKTFKHQGKVLLANRHYFILFPHEWIAGSPETSLDEPFEVVLTESRAKTYFSIQHASEAIGKEIIYEDSTQATVTGIVKDLEEITNFNFQEFVSLSTIETGKLKTNFYLDKWDFVNSNSQLLILLSENADPEDVAGYFPDILQKYAKEKEYDTEYQLQPLTDIHFNAKFNIFPITPAHKPTLYGLLVLAFFLLLLGCINFINLTTAAGSYRAKEISVRKTFGGLRIQIISQFLSETILVTLLATIVSVFLVPFIFQLFSDFLPKEVSQTSWMQPLYLLYLALLIVGVGVLAGFYPALVLSGFQPVLLVRKQGVYKNSKSWLRQSLIVFQFVIALCMVMGTLIVSEQIRFALNKDLGFKQEAIVTFQSPFDRRKDNSRYLLLEKFRSIPGIESVVLGGQPPASGSTSSSVLKFSNGDDIIETSVDFKDGGPGYVNTYEFRLLAGRNLQPSDTIKEFIINETYAKMLGFTTPEAAVGSFIQTGEKDVPIVGVVADFNMKSVREPIDPTVITTKKSQHRTFHVTLAQTKANTEVWKNALAKLEKHWKEIYPDEVFDYRFFDESIANFYKTEQNTAKLLRWATGLAILISCLGLFGLATFTVTKRTKEIGIRKVLGASVASILMLLSKDYIKLILISFAIAIPVANYFITEWLNNFAFKIKIGWWLIALPGILVLLIALLSVSSQSWKAAKRNPVDSLRYE